MRDYVTRYGLTYTIGLHVTGAVFHTYRVFGLPTQYFVDRNGVIVDRMLGPLDRAGTALTVAMTGPNTAALVDDGTRFFRSDDGGATFGSSR